MQGDSIPTQRWLRVGRSLVVVAVLLVVAACSTQFAYNRLDRLTHYYLSNRVSLDGSQSRELRENLQSFLAWHRRSELPRYAAFLDDFAQTASRPLTVREFAVGRQKIESFVRDAVAHGAPDAARWLQGLRPEQVDELFASFEEKERKARAEHCGLDPAERREKNIDKFIENTEDWTGKLRRSQRELIATRLAQFSGDSCEEISVQERSRLAFRSLVDRYRMEPDFAVHLARFMTRPEERWEADYRREREADRARFLELLAAINQSLNSEQRARAVERLRGFKEDLDRLAAAHTT